MDRALETVLIVDDDADLTLLLKITLPRHWTSARLTVLVAHTLDEARAVLALSPVDLVVLDLRVPGRNGLTAVHHLLHAMQRILGRLLPVVVLSGYLSDIMEDQALRLGMQACIQKGADKLPQRLAEAMRAAWARYQYIEERLRLVCEAGAHG